MSAAFSSALLLAFTACGDGDASSLEPVTGAVIRVAPAEARTAAGYFTIHNRTDKVDSLISASTVSALKVSFDAEITQGGMSTMNRLGVQVIAPGDSLVFAPGVRHLMLDLLAAPLVPGDTVWVTLHFAGGRESLIPFPVKVIGGD